MARRRKRYVPRPRRKVNATGTGTGRSINRALQQKSTTRSGQSLQGSGSGAEKGTDTQALSYSEKVALLLEDFDVSFDSDTTEEEEDRQQVSKPGRETVEVKLRPVSNTDNTSGSPKKDRVRRRKQQIVKKPLSSTPSPMSERSSTSTSSSSSSGFFSGGMPYSRLSLSSTSSEESTEDKSNSGGQSQHDVDKEPDYHALYLAKTKRNPKVPKGIHTCPQCDKTYVYYSQLRQHLQRHAKWKCDVAGCDFDYREKSDLVRHLKTVHGKSNEEFVDTRSQQCPICSKNFGSAKAVMEHRAVHDASGKYACKHCGKQFFYWQSRKTHQRACNGHGHDGKMRGVGVEVGTLDVTPAPVTQQQPPGKRVKRAYRRRKPNLKREVTAKFKKVAEKLMDEFDENTLSADEDSDDPLESGKQGNDSREGPLDLSIKTGNCPPTAFNFNKGGKKQGKISPKKSPPKKKVAENGNDDSNNDAEPVIHKPPDWRQQQEVLHRVAGRRDFLQDIDLRAANPVFTQMCYAAVEQVRQSFWGSYEQNFPGVDLLHYHRILAEYYYPQQFYGFPPVAIGSSPSVPLPQSPDQQSQSSEIDHEINEVDNAGVTVDIENV